MIPPNRLSTIAQKYNPDLLNKWITLIGQNYHRRFLYLKDEVLKEKNHPEWFFRLKNLIKKENIGLWNQFIDFCLREAQKLNYEDFSIDFSGCTFENEEECNFSGNKLSNINFYKATFQNKANFGNTTFEDESNFESAKFKGSVNFNYTVFKDGAIFENANFENEINFGIKNLKNINFKNTTFNSKINLQNKEFFNTSFERAIFKKTTNFEKATFEDEANFEKTTFEDEANFGNTAFKDKANFGNTTFEDEANFENANFENEINFRIKKFKNINFKNTTFNSKIDFQNKEFVNTNFEEAVFKKTTNFENATFEDSANFVKATFEDEANFGYTAFKDKANFGDTAFKDKTNFGDTIFKNEANFGKATFKEEANFQRVKFKGETDFFDAIFDNIDGKKIDFSNTTFKKNVKFDFSKGQANTELNTERYVEISFENATFEKKATFRRRKFAGDTSFIDAKFYYPPTFSAGEEYNPDLLNFTRTKLILSKTPHTLFLWKKDIEKNIEKNTEKDTRKDNKNKGSTKLTRVRNLRKLAGQIKEHDFEIDLFILERLLNSRINFKSKNFVLRYAQQILIFLYWGFSDYARKAWLPLTYLLISVLGLSVILSCVSKFHFWDALTVSATNAIPFVNRFSEKTQSIFNKYFGMEEIPNCYIWIFSTHSLFSIVMIFLFSLAIRNYFRIK